MAQFSALIIGHDTLTLNCARMLVEAGHHVPMIVTRFDGLRDWADQSGVPVVASINDLQNKSQNIEFEWILSVANLEVLPDAVLELAKIGAVNFHDGSLPAYAGLNAPVWAILNGETQHGITWHRIASGVDTGNILVQKQFPIADNETSLTLNTKCFAAAMDSFPGLMEKLAAGDCIGQPQDASKRSYFGRLAMANDRPYVRLDRPTSEALTLARALDHGEYWNPLALPRLRTPSGDIALQSITAIEAKGVPGTVLSVTADHVDVATSDGGIRLSKFRPFDQNWRADEHFKTGDVLPIGAVEFSSAELDALKMATKNEAFWRSEIELFSPVNLTIAGAEEPRTTPHETSAVTSAQLDVTARLSRFVLLAARHSDTGIGSVMFDINANLSCLSDWVPITFQVAATVADAERQIGEAIDRARSAGPFLADLPHRIPGIATLATSDFAISDRQLEGAAIWLSSDGMTLRGDATRLTAEEFALIAGRFEMVLQAEADAATSGLPMLGDKERDLILNAWNATEAPYDAAQTIHGAFEAQVERTSSSEALVFEGEAYSYSDLNQRANQVAHTLIERGVERGDLVGLNIRRSADLVIGALAIMKAGAAYVPLDPDYPADRVALYVEDSGASAILTEAALAADLPPHQAIVIEIDTDQAIAAASDNNPDVQMSGEDLAYLIYTSGSTGRPKGVMIEHRNVSNFFVGMDDRIAHQDGGTWLAVTSLSFDISVLELFWTLARGFSVVISGDENRTLVSNGRINQTGRGMEFSLFYWGNDDGVGRDKYRMLLEGAEFADKHGFCAVWTPERHFHAFGGPYPNPSITGAAVAAVTRNLAVRAGSCVAPLHHPARIAEEWAVIDNLTNGRAGLAVASGWQPHDFILQPQNTPPENKPAMYDAIEKLRALWRGDAVEFPMADGTMHPVVTQPRPVSKEIPLWVTTAGNPQTWIEAGEIGANVLTHLLGQSVDEVGEKIKLYHDALRKSGRNPSDHRVTLMLHSYVAETRAEAEAVAREPMKDYLRSAAGLIKQFAWAFPAFKKPKGVENPMQLDLGTLSEEELEAILDFAFLRYFEDSGLFGTVDDCLDRVEQLKRIGVDEVACLIDYGIERQKVLDGLRPLAEVLRLSNLGDELAEDDFSIAAQILRHNVTHLQATPSMARMIVGNEEAKQALGRVKHLMIGGEALPGGLVSDLKEATSAHIENMYGPTETTIWSTTQTAEKVDGIVGIGRPISNTQIYVLDEHMQPVPIGMAGELYIGGAGVARGYWQRADLTADRFLDDPYRPGNRIYRTGDLVRWRSDGTLDFLGRADHQIKLRGHRIELGEIETALDACEGVAQSVVLAREDVPGNVQLVGYYTGMAEGGEAALTSTMAQSLPDHMVPARFVAMEEFPLTPNKKIDRKALPAPAARKSATVTPITQQVGVAGKIAAIWGRTLGVDGIGPQDHFFHLGGHSLLAVQAHREIRQELGANHLSITDIFRFPTLADLAGRVEALLTPAHDPGETPPPASGLSSLANERAISRGEAMSRRRQMRAARGKRG